MRKRVAGANLLVAALAIGLALCGPAAAQIITSSIVGTVTDSSGAGVPDAKVVVTNNDTGQSATITADRSGAYAVTDLQSGTYTATVTQQGFETSRTLGIVLKASQSLRIDVQLKIGLVQENVEVTAQTPLITTESPTITGEVSQRQMSELPVAQLSIDTLLALIPGAQQNNVAHQQIGGSTYYGSVNFTINGTQANDIGNAAAAYSYNMGLVSLPPITSLQEFKVAAYDTNAEYRQLATVTMVTKSGSNAFHGELLEYNQNKLLEANTFVNNATGIPRTPLIHNQFGGNIGGPIKRNKAFFFFNYYGVRNRNYALNQETYPSAAMRQGNFSALCSSYGASGTCTDPKGTQLYNPFTGQPFPDNQIPSALITKQAQTLNSYLPLANRATNAAGLANGGANYFGLVSFAQVVNAYDARVDYYISGTDQLYGAFTHNVGGPLQVNLGYPSTYGNAGNYGYKTIGYSLVETHTFNPHTLNDFRAAWFDHPNVRAGEDQNFNPQSLFPQLTTSPNRGLPTMTISGYTSITDSGTGAWSHAPDLAFTDNLTWVHNRHTFKFGAEETTYRSYVNSPNAPLGTFTFSGQWTGNKGWPGQPKSQGNAYADFLLGTADSSQTGQAGVFGAVYWSRDSEFYAQDTWQARNNLTLTYGLRYVYQTPWQWQDGYSTYYDPKTNQLALPENSPTATFPPFGASAAQFNAYPFTTTQALGIPANYMVPQRKNFAPRVGLAYRPFSNNRTVFRVGWGIYYNFNGAYIGSRDDILNPPWLGGLGGFSTSNYITQLTSKVTSPFLPDVTFSNPFPSTLQAAGGASLNPTIYAMQRDFKTTSTEQWNATIEHQFAKDWAARITYDGNGARHLPWWFSDINVPLTQTPNVSIQNQRPYQPWAAIDSSRSGGTQNFEQLQFEAQKRFSTGFSFQAEYSWTRSLDDVEANGGPQQPAFPELDYGNSTGIRTHNLVFNYVYELPIGRGKPFLSNLNRAFDAVLGGWQIAGISTYASGAPFSVNFSVPSNYTGWLGGRASTVNGADLYANQGSGHDIISGVQWFNPAAFAAPQPWTWGDSSRNMLWGPGMWNWDISAAKKFKVTERAVFELRGDFFDAFNHFNLGTPGNTIGDTRDGGLPVSTAGKIYGGSGNRIGQVGAKLSF